MDRLSWCKNELEKLQAEIANDPEYTKEYALSAIMNQIVEYLYRKEQLEKKKEKE